MFSTTRLQNSLSVDEEPPTTPRRRPLDAMRTHAWKAAVRASSGGVVVEVASAMRRVALSSGEVFML
jgi:hypothetical protein